MKKLLLTAACLALLTLCACGDKAVEETYYDTLEAAEKLIGFELEAPEALDGSGTRTYCAKGRTLEIVYFDGKVLTGRISKSDNGENLSGPDYGYAEETAVTEDGVAYTFYGDGRDDLVYRAAWSDGEESYHVLVGTGRSPEELAELCGEIR